MALLCMKYLHIRTSTGQSQHTAKVNNLWWDKIELQTVLIQISARFKSISEHWPGKFEYAYLLCTIIQMNTHSSCRPPTHSSLSIKIGESLPHRSLIKYNSTYQDNPQVSIAWANHNLFAFGNLRCALLIALTSFVVRFPISQPQPRNIFTTFGVTATVRGTLIKMKDLWIA